MIGSSVGGNDIIIGGAASENCLVADADSMYVPARAGSDTLISGIGTDHMWGDARSINDVATSPMGAIGSVITQADTFVFAPTSARATATKST